MTSAGYDCTRTFFFPFTGPNQLSRCPILPLLKTYARLSSVVLRMSLIDIQGRCFQRPGLNRRACMTRTVVVVLFRLTGFCIMCIVPTCPQVSRVPVFREGFHSGVIAARYYNYIA